MHTTFVQSSSNGGLKHWYHWYRKKTFISLAGPLWLLLLLYCHVIFVGHDCFECSLFVCNLPDRRLLESKLLLTCWASTTVEVFRNLPCSNHDLSSEYPDWSTCIRRPPRLRPHSQQKLHILMLILGVHILLPQTNCICAVCFISLIDQCKDFLENRIMF